MDEDKEVKVNDTTVAVSNSGVEKQHGVQHSVAPYQLNYMSEAEIASLKYLSNVLCVVINVVLSLLKMVLLLQ